MTNDLKKSLIFCIISVIICVVVITLKYKYLTTLDLPTGLKWLLLLR